MDIRGLAICAEAKISGTVAYQWKLRAAAMFRRTRYESLLTRSDSGFTVKRTSQMFGVFIDALNENHAACHARGHARPVRRIPLRRRCVVSGGVVVPTRVARRRALRIARLIARREYLAVDASIPTVAGVPRPQHPAL